MGVSSLVYYIDVCDHDPIDHQPMAAFSRESSGATIVKFMNLIFEL